MEGTPAAARGEDVRQRLRAAAAELIPERGWAAVSTRILADRAGVTPSVVHYHYPSLRALLHDAVIEAFRRVVSDVRSALDDAAPSDAIDVVLAQANAYTGNDPASLLAIEGCLAAGRDPTLREQLRGVLAEFRGELADRLAVRGVEAPETTAVVLSAALDGLVLHHGLDDAPDPGALSRVLGRLVGSADPGGGDTDEREPSPSSAQPPKEA